MDGHFSEEIRKPNVGRCFCSGSTGHPIHCRCIHHRPHHLRQHPLPPFHSFQRFLIQLMWWMQIKNTWNCMVPLVQYPAIIWGNQRNWLWVWFGGSDAGNCRWAILHARSAPVVVPAIRFAYVKRRKWAVSVFSFGIPLRPSVNWGGAVAEGWMAGETFGKNSEEKTNMNSENGLLVVHAENAFSVRLYTV